MPEHSPFIIYYYGEGVNQDYAEAVRWSCLAAEQGDSGAQVNLGHYYYNGEGVELDYVAAYMWTYIAASSGNESEQEVQLMALENITDLETMMTPAEVEEAKAMAQLCLQSEFRICGD